MCKQQTISCECWYYIQGGTWMVAVSKVREETLSDVSELS